MSLSQKAQQTLNEYMSNPLICMMKNFKHHGRTSTYEHCVNVTNISCRILNKFKHKDETMENLIIGAMLHDFYLYDWHTGRLRPEGLHGFCHPKIALKLATSFFNLNHKQQNIIRSHMFPATLLHPPTCKEAWIVTLVDKYCAIMEYIDGYKYNKTKKQAL
ncbi:HD domain-containing protein [bacterium]|nr:HD domain-containing protein [bacterium]